MNEIALNAILNLFAVRASRFGADGREGAVAVVGRFLRSHLRIAQPQAYVELFEAALDLHRTGDPGPRLELARQIAANLKSRLPRFEQLVFMVFDLELANAGRVNAGGVEDEALSEVVASELAIGRDVLLELGLLAAGVVDPARLTHRFLAVNGPEGGEPGPCRRLRRPEFRASFVIYHEGEAGAWFIVPSGGDPISADSVELGPGAPHLLTPGFILRDGQGTRLYLSLIHI